MTRKTRCCLLVACFFFAPFARAQTFQERIDIVDRNRNVAVLDAGVDRQGNVFVSAVESPRDQLLRTFDGGRTWRAVNASEIPGPVRFVADPEDPETLYNCGQTLRRTTNGGMLWYDVHPEPCRSFAVDSGNRGVLLLLTYRGLFRSQDFGQTWNEVPTGTTNLNEVVSDYSGFGQLAAFTVAPGALFTSKDRGVTFERAFSLQGFVTSASFHPHRSGALYAVAGGQVYYRDPSGVWFLRGNSESGLPTAVKIYADRQFPDRVWASTVSGLYRSDDAARSWRKVLSGNYSWIGGCGSIAVSGTSGITWESPDGGSTWRELPPTHTMDFGAGCSGYALVYSRQSPTLTMRRFDGLGKLAWRLELNDANRLQPLGDGRLAYLGNGRVNFLAPNGSTESEWISRNGMVPSNDLQIGDDGSLAVSGFVPGLTAQFVESVNAEKTSVFLQEGTLLAIRPQDHAVAIVMTNGRVVIRPIRQSEQTETLSHLPGRPVAMRYFPNKDYVAAGWASGNLNALWIARYATGSTTPIWQTELPSLTPESVRISFDDGENVHGEVFTRPNRTFFKLDNRGKIEWLQTWPDRRLLLVDPQGMLSVFHTQGGGVRLESVTTP